MVNIVVFSQTNVSIENQDYVLTTQQEMLKFLEDLLNKAYYAGEKICLESAHIEENKVIYHWIDEW